MLLGPGLGECHMIKALVASIFVGLALTPAGAGAEVVRVEINQMKFQPQTVTVKKGDEVEWVNQEKRNNHSVKFPDLPESERMFSGDSYKQKFDTPGHFPYECGPHPEMKGVVEVLP